MPTPNPKSLAPLYLLDGGLGTTLADHFSIKFDESTPLWSSQLLLTDPKTLQKAQTAFAESGADVLLTVTYQASLEGFERSGVPPQEAGKHMRSAVGIARDAFRGAKGKEGWVALSLGAYGATMLPGQEYTGRYDEGHVGLEQLREWHLRRIGVFFSDGSEGGGDERREREECWGGVDLVAFETLPLLREVQAVRETMGDVSRILPEGDQKEFWICCVFPGEGNVLPDGSTVREVVKAMLKTKEGSALPMGIGINCTRIQKIEGLIEEFGDAVKEMVSSGETKNWPALVLYPDGTNGEVYNTSTKEWEKKSLGVEISWEETLYEIVTKARERREWKSIYVGGCCKTTPIEIGKLRKRIDKLS